VAQKAEVGNEVEEEVEQHLVLQIIFTRQGSGFISAYGESDVRGLMPVEGVKRNGFKLSQCAFNARLQLAESHSSSANRGASSPLTRAVEFFEVSQAMRICDANDSISGASNIHRTGCSRHQRRPIYICCFLKMNLRSWCHNQ